MRKLGIALYTIFALLFAVLPVFVIRMSLLATAEYEGFTLRPWLFGALGALALCLVPLELPRFPDWLAAPLWGCAAFQYRYHCFHLIEPHMVMKYDFATVLDSVRGIRQAKEAIFTHWAFYPRVLEWWNGRFGNDFIYRSAVYFDLAVGGLICLLVYLIACRVWKRQRAAMLAAAIVCFWPSFSYYASITSNEHPAMLLMLLTSYLGILAWQLAAAGREEGGENWVQKLPKAASRAIFAALVLLAGLCAGLTDLFKQFSPVFLIASFGAGLLFLLMESNPGRGEVETQTKARRKAAGRRICSLLLCIVIMFAEAGAVKERAYRWLEGYLDMPVARGATAHFLWIGLNSEGGGMWTEDAGMKVYELAEQYGNDYDKVMAGLMDLLKADLKAHPDSLKTTLQNKMEQDWGADLGVTKWIKSLYDEVSIWEEQTGEVFHDWSVSREELEPLDFDPGDVIARSSAAYYLCVMGLIALGALLAVFLRNGPETYLRLVFYGYALLFLLSEAQGRYQVVLFPIFALLAAGACEVAGGLSRMMIEQRKRTQARHGKAE